MEKRRASMPAFSSQNLALANIFFFSTAQSMVLVLVPLLAGKLVEKEALIGLIFAIPGAVSVLCELPIASWSDHIRRKPLILSGALCGLGAVLPVAIWQNIPALVLVTTLSALASTFFFPPMLAWLSESAAADDHPKVQGINGFAQGIASFGGVLFAGAVAEKAGFPTAFLASAAVYLVSLLFGLFLGESTRKEQTAFTIRILWQTYKNVFRLAATRGKIQLATLVEMIYTITISTVGNSFFPLYLNSQLGFTPSITGALISARNLTSTWTSLLFGRVSKRFSIELSLFGLMCLTVVVIFLLPLAYSLPVLVGLSILLGAGMGFVPAAPNIFIAEGTLPSERAVGYASVTLISRLSQMIMAPFFGILAQSFGLTSVFLAGGLTAGFILVLYFWKIRHQPAWAEDFS